MLVQFCAFISCLVSSDYLLIFSPGIQTDWVATHGPNYLNALARYSQTMFCDVSARAFSGIRVLSSKGNSVHQPCLKRETVTMLGVALTPNKNSTFARQSF